MNLKKVDNDKISKIIRRESDRYDKNEGCEDIYPFDEIPDVRDGLIPVYRRILWAMRKLSFDSEADYQHSSQILRKTMVFHPHVRVLYCSLARLGQVWLIRYPMVDLRGNFGNIDGYPPAGMRFTAANLSNFYSKLFDNVSDNIVPFIDNKEASEKEPTILATKLPYLLLNGYTVGTSNIPPHNIVELSQACMAIILNPEITVEGLMGIISGPDFPTGGIIVGTDSIQSLYRTGEGKLTIRSRIHLETPNSHKVRGFMIVVDEIPYLQNKTQIVRNIYTLIDNRQLRGVKDVRDRSREKIRIEIDIHNDYTDERNIQQILDELFQETNLETVFHAKIKAIVDNKTKILDLKQVINQFLYYREQTVKAIAMDELECIDHDLSKFEEKSIDQNQERIKRKKYLEGIINNRQNRLISMRREFQMIIKNIGDERRTSIQLDSD